MSKWNWIHAGLQAATYYEMRQVKAALEQEQIRRAIIEAIRQYIFDISKAIRLAMEYSEQYPMQVYSILRYFQLGLENSGIDERHLPDVNDKEYFFNVQYELEKNLKSLQMNLEPQELQKAALVAEILFEKPLLEEIISVKEASDSLQATEAVWKSLSSKYGWRIPFFLFIIIIMSCGGCSIASAIAESIRAELGVIGSLLGVIIVAIPILLTLGSLIGIFQTRRSKGYKRYKNMAQMHKKWYQILQEWQNKREEFVERFGTDDIDELYDLAKRRLNLLKSYFPAQMSFKKLLQLSSNNNISSRSSSSSELI